MNISPQLFEDTETGFATKSNSELSKARALFKMVGNPRLVNTGSALAALAIKLRLPVSPLFRYTVYNQFCGGETFDECKQTIEVLQKHGVGVLLNYGVELKSNETDFDRTMQANIEAINFAGSNRSVKGICIKVTGFGSFELFEKIQTGHTLTASEKEAFERVRKRLETMCQLAEQKQVALYVDAEESWIQEPLDTLVEEMMMRFNRQHCTVLNTFQLYRWDRIAYLQAQIQKARAGNYILGAKLVRGAYMEKERERAKQMNYRSPVHETKQEVDSDFNLAVTYCLDNVQHVYVCIASQSEASNLYAITEMQRRKISDTQNVLFSQLYGMGDNITFNLSKYGYQATKYLPYGPVKDVMPYLIRRAQENTSVGGQTGRELALIEREISRRKKAI